MLSSDDTHLNASCVAIAKNKINNPPPCLKAVKLFMLLKITQHFLKTEKYEWPLDRQEKEKGSMMEARLIIDGARWDGQSVMLRVM